MRGQRRRLDETTRKLYFPSGRARRRSQRNYLLRLAARRRPARARTVLPGLVRRRREPVTPAPLRAGTDSLVRRPAGLLVSWSFVRSTGRTQRVSARDPLGDGSSSLDYICATPPAAPNTQRRQ